jgi:uncharacterized protein (DUF1499 family)
MVSRRDKWAHGLSWTALVLSLGGVAAALVAGLGNGAGWWTFGAGLGALRYALYAAVAGGLLAIVAWFMARKTGARTEWVNGLALISAVAFTAYLGNQILEARKVPAIHEASTDLDDLPQFRALALRSDYLENIPDLGRAELAALPALERWKAIHREAYGDLKPLRLAQPPAEVLRRAEELARSRGWNVAGVDQQAGTIEATATTLFFRFKDDVVVRVRPDPSRAGGSVIDMRSISRVGRSDLGVNAKRVRAFLRDLGAAAS